MNYLATSITTFAVAMMASSAMADERLERLHTTMDVNQDTLVSHAEFIGHWGRSFDRRDKNHDGTLNGAEVGASSLKVTDENGDGVVSREEELALRQRHFERMDKDENQSLTLTELVNSSTRSTGQAAVKPKAPAGQSSYAAQRASVEALSELTSAPKMWLAEGFDSTDELAAIYFDALDWKGSHTKVFAWLGLPEDTSGKVPGVVLVHGGGGTAFKDWVKQWNARGYAAISIAVEGQTDVKDSNGDHHAPWQSHAWPGPKRSGIYGDSSERLQDQWMYHAVANTILANSLLSSLPEVDAESVGIMGVSWGGVITSAVIGIDERFAFAIPVYGCGDLSTAQNQYGRSLGQNEVYKQVWDPILGMNEAHMPTLWFSWPQDKHFPLDLQANCYGAQPGQHMVSLVPNMGHGHGSAWNRPESYAFADSVLNESSPWCLQKSAKQRGAVYKVIFQSSKSLDSAELVSTVDSGVTGSRQWVQTPLKAPLADGARWTVTADIPTGSTAWYINVKSGELISSSDFYQTP
ncbi:MULTISPECIES: acetylxylan esterase [unclassified Lentimonas]|uniref:acetylxylan esterase n=1 Tax=unclassified Lentimonas TaxID=2630993 RepID=UPI00132C16FC|nr:MULTISPECIES: acetylxylan esterase [unclassified Lentimonas]CAA6679898.1 Unannotated [Lentimonas sp. CC4]CAA6683466.1 Unannotated [Lentimonas sp. CC6]CAA7078057.1 Unannotated [Lentimonas sp. CC4]CAA7171646.1 Unannotated [Lentimonas sp. CC21]CAA7181432.1 Unannotated [Lentimonas sp. CC8]